MTNQTDTTFMDQLLERRTLHCVYCKSLLRIPVMLVEEKGNMCYSCYEDFRESDDIVALENVVVTSILKQMVIPCPYKAQGCDKRLKYKHLQNHRDNCAYQPFSCNFSSKCFWTGCLEEVLAHCSEFHAHKILRNSNDCYKFSDIQHVEKGTYILETSYGLFILKIKKIEADLKILIYDFTQAVENVGYSFNIIFTTENGNNYSRRLEAIKDLKSFIKFDDSLTVTINLDSVNNLLFTEYVADPLSIYDIFCDDKNVETSIELVNDDKDSFLQKIECTVCKLYNSSVVYDVCLNGHSFCSSCTQSNVTCQQCKYPVVQNISVDKLACLVRLPCHFKNKGCLMKIRENSFHEFLCNYRKCFKDDCNTICCYYPNLISHAKICHGIADGFINLPTLSINNNNTKEMKIYYVVEHNLMFELTYENQPYKDYNGRNTVTFDLFMWSVNIIRGYNPQHFIFEVEICLGRNNPVKEIVLRGFCKYKRRLKFEDTPVKLSGNALNQMGVTNGTSFDYKVRVFKEFKD